jgi:hypothetical protein
MYEHEARERKVNTHPMCTELPVQSVFQHNMNEYIKGRNLSWKLARSNGWYESDKARDAYRRVVIPAVTHKAGHVYWQARDIFGKAFIRYQSPKGPRHEALVKVVPSSTQLGIVVVEGPMDALAAAGEGYLGIALMGMTPSTATMMHLCLLLEESPAKRTLVALDRDSAENATRICTFVSSQGYSCRMASLPEKDLAACLPEVRRKFLKQSFQSLFRLKSSAQPRKDARRA